MAGILTFSQLAVEVCNTVQRDPTALARDAATTWLVRAKQFINWAQTKIAQDASVLFGHDFSDFQTEGNISLTYAGGGSYDEPADCKSIYSLHLSGAVTAMLRFRPMKEFFERYPIASAETTGQPIDWTSWNHKIWTNCVPNVTYTANLKYVKWPTQLTLDADVSSFPGLDRLIVTCAVYMAYEALLETEEAAHWRTEFDEQLKRCVAADATRLGESVPGLTQPTGT